MDEETKVQGLFPQMGQVQIPVFPLQVDHVTTLEAIRACEHTVKEAKVAWHPGAGTAPQEDFFEVPPGSECGAYHVSTPLLAPIGSIV